MYTTYIQYVCGILVSVPPESRYFTCVVYIQYASKKVAYTVYCFFVFSSVFRVVPFYCFTVPFTVLPFRFAVLPFQVQTIEKAVIAGEYFEVLKLGRCI